jgi:hypothetical protein
VEMTKFRAKPVAIDAVQYIGPTFETWSANLPLVTPPGVRFVVECRNGVYGWAPVIETPGGRLPVSEGDWIIRGVKGELYPCKPGIFAATYEPADAHAEPVPPVTLGEPSACPTCKRPPPGFEYVGAVASKS